MNHQLKAEYEKRLEKTREEAVRRGFSALLVFGLAPRRVGDLMYLTGHQPMLPGHPRRFEFRGRGYSVIVLPVEGEACLLTTTPFYERDLYLKDVTYVDNLPTAVCQQITKRGLTHADIGIVGMDILGAALYEDLKCELNHVRFYHADDIVMNLRAVKSPYELSILREGASIADEVAVLLRQWLSPGKTEWEVYQFITSELSKRGVSNAFATCQSGTRSETPYELEYATQKVIQDGDMVHMEINGKLDGYMIDICRSTVVGKSTPEQRRILDLALEMFEQGAAAMRPGVTAESIETVTGTLALQHGFDHNHTRRFGGKATLAGHAIGLGVDEPPVLATGDITRLVPGMVITLEPGIYETGFGGCRVEDELLITESGCENLNRSERKWW